MNIIIPIMIHENIINSDLSQNSLDSTISKIPSLDPKIITFSLNVIIIMFLLTMQKNFEPRPRFF